MKIRRQIYRIENICKRIFVVAVIGLATSVVAQTNHSSNASVNDSVVGRIVDGVSRKPLAGAIIQSVDARYSVMTDENGKFSVKLPTYLHTLVVSVPGYDKKEVRLYKGEKSKEIQVYQSYSENYFDDKVSIFGAKRKSTVASSLSSVEVDNLSSISVDTELRKYFSGDMRQSSHSGVAASGLFMLIRGINSLNANNQPLLVVDGVILNNQREAISIHLGNNISQFAGLDVNDIQSISVLKDGVSLYGSKGGNGVILVNTNRGRSMATKVGFTSILGSNTKPKSIPMMNADQYRLYLSDVLNSGTSNSSINKLPFFNTSKEFIDYPVYNNNTNWQDLVHENSPVQSYNIGVNGGDETALYNLSLGYTNALNSLKNNEFNRLNARFNSDINLSKSSSIAFDISYSQLDRDLRNDGISESNKGSINSPGFLSLIKSPFLSPYKYNRITKSFIADKADYDLMGVGNPFVVLDEGVGRFRQSNFNIAITPKVKLTPSFTLMSRLSYTKDNLSEHLFSPMEGVAPFVDVENYMVSYNYVKTQFVSQSSLFSDSRANWKKGIRGNLFELNLGARIKIDAYKSDYAEGHNTGSNQAKEMSGDLISRKVDGVDENCKDLAYYGTFNYSFGDKYFIETSYTAETNSRYGLNAKSGVRKYGVNWALFPSFNMAWIVSSENFMKHIRLFDQLKLRAGVGMSGNDAIENTASRTYLKNIKYYDNAIGLELHNLGNSSIQWEMVTKRNVGLDASLLNSRLTLSFDLYDNTTDNLLVLKNAESYSGYGTYWANDGKLSNKGYEVAINAKVISSTNLNVSLGASVAHYENKILALTNGSYNTPVYDGEVRTEVNQPIGQFFGYSTNGVFATAQEATNANLSVRDKTGALLPLEAGDVRFVDKNEDHIIDEKDKCVIGNSNPDFFGAFNANVKYKKLGLQFILNYSYGNDIYNYQRSQIESGSTLYNQSAAMANRWMSEGQVTSIPKSVYGDPKKNNRFSDRWIEDGSFVRLKTVELSYELPVKKLAFLQGATFWVSANNLWTFTRYLGADPEFSTNNNILYQGVDTGLLPMSRSFYVGLKLYL